MRLIFPRDGTTVGGTYERNGSGVWSSSAGTVANGDTVRVRHTSAANTTLTIGGASDTFTSTTLAAPSDPTVPRFLTPIITGSRK